MPGAQRLDAALVARGLSASRTLARKAIEAGRVRVRRAGHPQAEAISKPAAVVGDSDELSIDPAPEDQWVSRGALKLAGALDATGLDPSGLSVLDVGQSTGGFTDLLLQRGATRVLGVDVGHGQLHQRLQANPRVRCIEGFNARDISAQRLAQALVEQTSGLAGPASRRASPGEKVSSDPALPKQIEHDCWLPDRGFDLIVVDVSFISLLKISEGLKTLMAAGGHGLWLVKPQFEVGPAQLGKGGLVRPEALGPAFEQKICDSLSAQGFAVRQFMPSPIAGGDGNREYFVWVRPES